MEDIIVKETYGTFLNLKSNGLVLKVKEGDIINKGDKVVGIDEDGSLQLLLNQDMPIVYINGTHSLLFDDSINETSFINEEQLFEQRAIENLLKVYDVDFLENILFTQDLITPIDNGIFSFENRNNTATDVNTKNIVLNENQTEEKDINSGNSFDDITTSNISASFNLNNNDNIIIFNNNSKNSIDFGLGYDILETKFDIDFSNDDTTDFKNLEEIYLKEGADIINLTVDDILRITDMNNDLIIKSDKNSSVQFIGKNWKKNTIEGEYTIYTNSKDNETVTVKIQQNITDTII